MAHANEILLDGFGRVAEDLPALLSDLGEDQLGWRPGPEANPIGWLVWHLARVEDDHVAGLAGRDQVYPDFADRFDLPYPVADHGYGHSSEDVGRFRATADLLAEYYAAVHAATVSVVSRLSEEDYTRVVDDRWDPPVTAAVRLVSVVNDITQHLGQAAYVKGLLGSRR